MVPRRLLILTVAAFCLLCVGVVSAASCPADILLALSRAHNVCAKTPRDTFCDGNGVTEVWMKPDNVTAAQVGDRIPAANIDRTFFVGDPDETWTVDWLRLQANLPATEQRSVTLILLGEMGLVNLVPPTPTVNVSARANVNIRQTPETNGTILTRAAFGASLVANGRTEKSDWLRVQIPNQEATGWVSAQTLNSGDFSTLEVVDMSGVTRHPFEAFRLIGGSLRPCPGAPQSGLVLETPNVDDEVQLTVNDAVLRITGTAFLRTDQTHFIIHLVEGVARIEADGVSQTLPAGAQVRIPLGADGMVNSAPELLLPNDADVLTDAVVAMLDRPVAVAAPLTQDQIAVAIGAAEATPGPTPEATADAEVCERTTFSERNVRRGPGEDYPVVGALDAGDALDPVAQTTLPDGAVWWKLYGNRWLLADSIKETGPCVPPPETPFVRLPGSNSLRLETCETSNGPIRSGQIVTISFTPPAYRTIAEAESSVSHRRGRIQVWDGEVPVSASEPVQVGEYRYLVTFSGQWMAQAGNYRIAGSHLSYRLICNLTVTTGG